MAILLCNGSKKYNKKFFNSNTYFSTVFNFETNTYNFEIIRKSEITFYNIVVYS